MIGERLSERQVCVMQAIANVCGMGQHASHQDVCTSIAEHPNCKALQDADADEVLSLLESLKPSMVAETELEGRRYFALTMDGFRCNRIMVWD